MLIWLLNFLVYSLCLVFANYNNGIFFCVLNIWNDNWNLSIWLVFGWNILLKLQVQQNQLDVQMEKAFISHVDATY